MNINYEAILEKAAKRQLAIQAFAAKLENVPKRAIHVKSLADSLLDQPGNSWNSFEGLREAADAT